MPHFCHRRALVDRNIDKLLRVVLGTDVWKTYRATNGAQENCVGVLCGIDGSFGDWNSMCVYRALEDVLGRRPWSPESEASSHPSEKVTLQVELDM